jgi:hypothetical protein
MRPFRAHRLLSSTSRLAALQQLAYFQLGPPPDMGAA